VSVSEKTEISYALRADNPEIIQDNSHNQLDLFTI